MNKRNVFFALFLMLITFSSASDENTQESIVKRYYASYNQKDYAALNALISDQIVLTEMGHTVLQGKAAYIDLVEWGEALNSENRLKKLSTVNGKIVTTETEHSDRIKFLYGKPIKAKTTFTIRDGKITRIDVDLIDFDLNRMIEKKEQFENWLVATESISSQHGMDLATINRLNRAGGEAFRKAMELYESR